MSMEIVRSHLSRVKIPGPSTRIFKQECCVSFDTPVRLGSWKVYELEDACFKPLFTKSEGGLYIDLNSFLAFGKDYVAWNFEKTGNPLYLHIKQTGKKIGEDRPSKKPTLLAIGLEGGFDNNEPEYDETHNIVVLPEYITFPFPSVQLPEKIRMTVDTILRADGAERKEQVAVWTADKKITSAFAENLPQIDNGVTVPPSGWKCSKCDKRENLWLNLTDGMILCGRKNWDGTGGNDHAVEHFKETGYPLAVKLGTVTADLEQAGGTFSSISCNCSLSRISYSFISDVFSYSEDESVIDPLLAQHLQFFGIDFSSLQKTEMTTAERELDQNTSFDWNRIQESGHDLVPVFGPGYTGLVNLGNSCYLAATMQVMFSTRSFCSRYYMNQHLKSSFEIAPADPTVDLNMQLTKLAHGMLSGKYSFPVSENEDTPSSETSNATKEQEGIPPRMFKSVIAASHPEFSSMRQQEENVLGSFDASSQTLKKLHIGIKTLNDALEFFLHFLDQVERVNSRHPNLDPSRCFKFGIEERILCSSGKVAYNKRNDYILSLNIPLHEAKELEAFNKLNVEKNLEGEDVSSKEIVRPRVPLEACLANFAAPEEIHDFFSTALNAKTTAIKTAGLTTFPDYLVLHMRKFLMEAGWVPKKLDVYVDVPDIIDISHMRSKGLQPGEDLLPEAGADDEVQSSEPVANPEIVAQLVSMGFNQLHCEKASINTSNAGVEEAMNWLLSHMDDADIDAPISRTAQGSNALSSDDRSKVDMLITFGFSEDVALKALKATGFDVEKATDWIFNNPQASSPTDMDITASSSNPAQVDGGLPDGEGKYKLLGFVSHIGTSTQCGHYVAHILKEGRWVIFNDAKVGVSTNPPKDMGYLYFFERIIP
ncbi:hypothetical protein ACFE04_022712 [Oxalis oulophora]